MKKKFAIVITVLTATVMGAVLSTACGDSEAKRFTFLSVTPYSAAEVPVGTTMQLYGVVESNEITDKSVVFASDDESVLSVDTAGIVTAKKVGEAIVTVTVTAKTEISKSIKITVVPANEEAAIKSQVKPPVRQRI